MLLPLVILAQAGIQFRSRAPLKAHHLLQGRYAAIADKSVRATKFRESRKAPRKKRWIPVKSGMTGEKNWIPAFAGMTEKGNP